MPKERLRLPSNWQIHRIPRCIKSLIGMLKRPRWWINERSPQWREWALLDAGGNFAVYDDEGRLVRRTHYGYRHKAISALKRMGYRRLTRRDMRSNSPPQVNS